MTKIMEERFIIGANIRELCAMHGWFTEGTEVEFADFIDKWRGKRNLTTLDLMDMAEELTIYSLPSTYKEMDLLNMVWDINNSCYFHFEVVED